MTKTEMPTRVAVLGLGYVGCVTAACLARLGHTVIGVDPDEHKVRSVLDGRSPFYEPGLGEIIAGSVAAGRLSATQSLEQAIADAGIAIVCVGTPSERSGNLGLGQLRKVCEEIAPLVAARPDHSLIVAIRSTVFPGTCEQVVAAGLGGKAIVVANPEFLREGTAVNDFLAPSLVVVGGNDRAAVERVAALYAPLGVEACLVSLRTAEMIKYACNAFHAVKIGFANEIGALSGQLGVPAREVMDTLCRDTRLNLSAAYLKPGFAFGGSCLPKDLRALSYRAVRLDLKLPLLDSVLFSNERHLQRAVQAALELGARRMGVFGLAFKENTDDLRESPVVSLLEQLIGKGVELRVFDPYVQLDKIYGSNRNFLLSTIPHIGRLLASSLDDLTAWADRLVIAQMPAPDAAAALRSSNLPMLDLVGAFAASPYSVIGGAP